MDVSEAQRLKGLEDENRRLKHLVADLSLDKEVLKGICEKTAGAFHEKADVSISFFVGSHLVFVPAGAARREVASSERRAQARAHPY